MPHFPARSIPGRATPADWLARYRDQAGGPQALVQGRGIARPRSDFHAAMQLLETGLFDGFTDLHIAGHPEGSRDLDRGQKDSEGFVADHFARAPDGVTKAQRGLLSDIRDASGLKLRMSD